MNAFVYRRGPWVLLTASLLLALSSFASPTDDPFAGWSAEKVASHRAAAERDVLERASAWMKMRTNVLVICPACRGRGRLRSFRAGPCLACAGSGRRVNDDLDTSGFAAFYRPGRAEDLTGYEWDWARARKAGAWDKFPLVLAHYTIVEVRALGDVAVLFAFTRNCRSGEMDEDPPARPEIVWWVRHEGTWLVYGRGCWGPRSGYARYPEEHRPRPRGDPAAELLIEKGRSLQDLPVIPAGKRLTFRAIVASKSLRRPARLAGAVTTTGDLSLRSTSSSGGYGTRTEEHRLIVDTLRRVLVTGVAPDPKAFHVRHDGSVAGVVVFKAFAPGFWPDAWKVRFGDIGLPVSLEPLDGGPRIDVTWKEQDGHHLPVEFVSARMSQVVDYVKFTGYWVPRRLKLEVGGRQFTVTLNGYRFR